MTASHGTAGFLIDTNVLSEARKGARANAGVRRFFADVDDEALHISVLVCGEIRKGIELLRAKDPRAANVLDRWLAALERDFASRILPVDGSVADPWGRLDALGPVSAIDGLLAATALTHDLTLVTRNVRHVRRTGVTVLDPFAER